MNGVDSQRLTRLEAALRDLTARLAEPHPTAEGFVLGSTRLFEKLVSDESHLHQRDSSGVESDLTGAKSLQGVPVSDTAPTSGYVLAYNSATGEWEPTASSTPGAHVLATTAGLGASHTTSGLTAGQVLRATGATTAAFQAIQDVDLPSSICRDSELAAHEAAADPHTGYQKESEKDQASGYAGLDASQKVIKDPANATATPTASKIPIAGAGGKLAAGWIQEVLAHADLTDAPEDAHHAKIHGLAEHNTGSARISVGLDADKPGAGTADRLYWATDTKILYRDAFLAWYEIGRAETVTRLAQLAEKAHDSLTGVGIDDHHSKVHGSATHTAQSDAEAIHDNVAGEIAALAEKATPVSADLLLIEDSAASNAKKKVQVGNLPGGNGGGGGDVYHQAVVPITDELAVNAEGPHVPVAFASKASSVDLVYVRSKTDMTATITVYCYNQAGAVQWSQAVSLSAVKYNSATGLSYSIAAFDYLKAFLTAYTSGGDEPLAVVRWKETAA